MTTLVTMFDDIDVSLLPPGATAVAGYVDGRFRNVDQVRAKFPHAQILTIAVFAQDDAECLDVEPGDATRADIFRWFKRQQARGVHRPVIYSSVVNIDAIVATMTANGFHRDSYRLWSAHYGQGKHICGPSTCKLTRVQCDGTQFTNHALARSLDESVLLPGFFGAPPPAPAPAPGTEEPEMIELDTKITSHSLLIPFGTSTMDLLSTAPESEPCVVEVTFLDQSAKATRHALSWGGAGAQVTVPDGIKKARVDVVSGGGLPIAVRFNP